MIYVCNVDEDSIITGNELSKQVERIANETSTKVLNISADIESEISLIENLKEKQEFLLSIGLKETSLSKLIREGYDLLNLLTFLHLVLKNLELGLVKKVLLHQMLELKFILILNVVLSKQRLLIILIL